MSNALLPLITATSIAFLSSSELTVFDKGTAPTVPTTSPTPSTSATVISTPTTFTSTVLPQSFSHLPSVTSAPEVSPSPVGGLPEATVVIDGARSEPPPLLFDDIESIDLWNGHFVPPPPRPPFLIEEPVLSDGLTTCDLCSWAMPNSKGSSYIFEGTLGKI